MDDASWLDSYVEEAELIKVCSNFELWKIEESSAALNTLTHGFFRYFGKFPPPVATRFIKEFHDPSVGPVVDPMVGSGTTLVEAILLNRKAVGMDVNPLSALIAKVKTTPIRSNLIDKGLIDFTNFWSGYVSEQEVKKYIPEDKYLSHWFFPETQYAIAKTLVFINRVIDDKNLKDLFTVALASTIRRLSRASNGLGRMFLDPGKAPLDVYETVSKQILKMAPGLNELSLLNPNVVVINQDAKKPYLRKNYTNLVIVHPPYFNLYKYSSIYKFEMLWLGLDIKNTRQQEISDGFKIGKKEIVYKYIEDMKDIFANILNVLVPGGICVLMMGDTILRGERINTTYMTLDTLSKEGFKVEKIIIRPPKFTEASYAATQRRTGEQVGIKLADYLVVLRKGK